MHTKKIQTNSYPPIVSILALFGIALFLLWNTESEVYAQVPKGDHGAAEMDIILRLQMHLLLLPKQNIPQQHDGNIPKDAKKGVDDV